MTRQQIAVLLAAREWYRACARVGRHATACNVSYITPGADDSCADERKARRALFEAVERLLILDLVERIAQMARGAERRRWARREAMDLRLAVESAEAEALMSALALCDDMRAAAAIHEDVKARLRGAK